jgi:hypothetical protein
MSDDTRLQLIDQQGRHRHTSQRQRSAVRSTQQSVGRDTADHARHPRRVAATTANRRPHRRPHPDLRSGQRSRRPDRWWVVSTDHHTGGATGRSFPDLSTAHLPEQLGSYGLSGQDGVVAYQLEYGWLMKVPADPQAHAGDYPDLPPEVLAMQRDARGLGCDYVLFDADADQVGDLPTWDW